MSEDTSVPWKGAGQIKHSRGTSCYYFFFLTSGLVISKEVALFAPEGCSMDYFYYPHSPENAAVLPHNNNICLTSCLGATTSWKEFS